MDPDANLKEQLEIAHGIVDASDDEVINESVDNAERLAELILALDGWIKAGGFLPKGWKR